MTTMYLKLIHQVIHLQRKTSKIAFNLNISTESISRKFICILTLKFGNSIFKSVSMQYE